MAAGLLSLPLELFELVARYLDWYDARTLTDVRGGGLNLFSWAEIRAGGAHTALMIPAQTLASDLAARSILVTTAPSLFPRILIALTSGSGAT